MVKRIWIVRHGVAVEHGTPGIADDERPLTAEGSRKMVRAAAGLERLRPDPELILTSPLPRARRTAEIVAQALRLSDRLEDAAELRASARSIAIRDWLLARPEDALMVVGHDPWCSELPGLLIQGAGTPVVCHLKKGGVIALEREAEGAWAIAWLAPPGLLRKLGR